MLGFLSFRYRAQLAGGVTKWGGADSEGTVGDLPFHPLDGSFASRNVELKEIFQFKMV